MVIALEESKVDEVEVEQPQQGERLRPSQQRKGEVCTRELKHRGSPQGFPEKEHRHDPGRGRQIVAMNRRDV
jgi:hypothetical protein